MNSIEAQRHIDECRRLLDIANQEKLSDYRTSVCIGGLIIAIEQLAEVVEDLAKREQGKVIQ